MISIKQLSVSYHSNNVLQNLSLNLKDGEIYSLIGPSGCGKSTLLKVLSGIKNDYSGVIEYNGNPIEEEPVSIGYVPQNYGLLEWKTVKSNIYLPLKLSKRKTDETENEDILQSLEIKDLLKKYPKELSGGQKQRVALARAFINRPNLLLMDEPFSALDAFTSLASQDLFLRIWEKYRVTTLFITHNISEAVSIGRHILLMNKTEKKIVARIDNNTLEKPGNDVDKMQLTLKVKELFEKSISNE